MFPKRYDAGNNTFDTANVHEIILGKAIKELRLPQNEIVVMTKVRLHSDFFRTRACANLLGLLHCGKGSG
jgi:aryl-alcohol dehydrogenase-like predicted oxidoreductase